MNDKDTRAAIIAVALWSAAFSAGMVIADMASRPVGFMLMIFSTLFFAVVLAMDYRLEKKQERIDNLVKHDMEQVEEALRKCE